MSQKVDLQVLAGDYVKKAYIAEWKVKVGDKVKKDDVLLCCETGKVTVDIVSPCDGVLFTLREYPLVYEGSLLARVLAREEVRA